MTENNNFGKQKRDGNILDQTNQGKNIIIGRGNYNENIKGNYYENNIYNINPKQEQLPEICINHKRLKQYLQATAENLKQKFGFIDFKSNFTDDELNIRLAARKPDFEMSIGFLPMRGEAFFIFSELENVQFTSLTAFSTQCLNYAKAKIYNSTIGSAFYNLKVPNNMCFAIALVDKIDEVTKKTVRQQNPLRVKVDALWYEIPVVYELSTKQLYFYEKSLNFRDKMTGEIAWKEIRKIIKKVLIV